MATRMEKEGLCVFLGAEWEIPARRAMILMFYVVGRLDMVLRRGIVIVVVSEKVVPTMVDQLLHNGFLFQNHAAILTGTDPGKRVNYSWDKIKQVVHEEMSSIFLADAANSATCTRFALLCHIGAVRKLQIVLDSCGEWHDLDLGDE